MYVDGVELNQRWDRLRAMMTRRNLSMLIVFNARQQGEGEWLTGLYSPSPEWPSGGIIVPMGGGIIAPMSVRPFPETHGEGFGGIEATPNPMVKTTQGFELTDIKDYLLAGNTVGTVNPEYMSAELYEFLLNQVDDIRFEDVSDEFFQIMMVKTPKEQEVIKDAAAIHDTMAQTIRSLVRPERLESEIVKDIRKLALSLGTNGEDPGCFVNVDLTSSPDGQPAEEGPFTYPGRRVGYGDRVNISFRMATVFGVYSQVSRSYVIGQPSQQTEELWNTAVEASRLCAEMIRPGVTLAQVYEKLNEFLREAGCQEDHSVSIHGIGYAPVCYPYRDGEKEGVTIQKDMYLSIHPVVRKEGVDAVSCGDTYLVTEDGAVRLSKLPQELILV